MPLTLEHLQDLAAVLGIEPTEPVTQLIAKARAAVQGLKRYERMKRLSAEEFTRLKVHAARTYPNESIDSLVDQLPNR